MNFAILIDGASAAIVLGGTALGTLLRSGLGDCRLTLAKLAQLGQRRFDAAATRAELALQVQEIRTDGLLRARPHHFDDNEFAEATDALIGERSLEALLERHTAHRARRLAQSERAVRTLAQGAELAPVFGLAGTLISLSQMPVDGAMRAGMAGAIAMAVVTTLYGLLLSNLLLAPLARIVERAAQAEEAERQAVIDWLAAQLAPSMPARRAAVQVAA
ncbi:MotA/TolQ/ExbB proton channel family protein [Novosphingobium sp.]|jgi:chemotaxis protein MotA|uniref:MotA/TolQ/ExbB proton channel family protein n=1 Tax=Novosphingobium sp. TaxID=1874826 RepID=UPI001EC8F401|nr:MotA/TolQ/ExbB proton channel family protein [Novosphingobium sp.]MBK6801893.1 MotA/TolQ/ExbB proton channel family protein [Novosphingobium sp.]MBK9010265.1 MotA/TolQ/ExbB proton channel family protein [Novosphingobium sp.]